MAWEGPESWHDIQMIGWSKSLNKMLGVESVDLPSTKICDRLWSLSDFKSKLAWVPKINSEEFLDGVMIVTFIF